MFGISRYCFLTYLPPWVTWPSLSWMDKS